VSASGPGFFQVGYYLPNLHGCSDTAYRIIEVEPVSGNGTLYLQNTVQTDSGYFAADTIYTGQNVTNTVPYGPYIIQPGAEVFFKAETTLIMKPGTRINTGSHFMARILPLNCSVTNMFKTNTVNESITKKIDPQVFLGPNPTSGTTSLYISEGTFEGYRIQVLNNRGIMVREYSNLAGNRINLNFEGLPVGLYMIRLWNENSSFTIKMVKN